MGTSGNRPGYKIFSINTTVRNPLRNERFLQVFKPFSGRDFTDDIFHQYYAKLVETGIYTFAKTPNHIKNKLSLGEILTENEIEELIDANPQACGSNGRVMTQLRALKDQGFLMFEPAKRRKNKITISNLGLSLIDGSELSTDVYSKVMIGMHANNPSRVSIFNKSRPFLNTLFTINEVNKKWKALGKNNTGITFHEFGAFVLSMKDCDFQKASDEIIKYRKIFGFKINKEYLEKYCYKTLNLIKGDFKNIIREYPDDVYRKMEMTGLLIKRNRSVYSMIDFSTYNIEKIKSILKMYSKYKFETFNSISDYYRFLDETILPWQKDKQIRILIAKGKAKQLNIKIDDYSNINEVEKRLDGIFYNEALRKTINEIDISVLRRELLILSGESKAASVFKNLDEPLRLEYVLALILGKKYGEVGLVSNIIYNEDGQPLHHAPSQRADIIYNKPPLGFVLEPTMTRNSQQMTNTETTSVSDHVKQLEIKKNIIYRAMMIAPYVNKRVSHWFKFTAVTESTKIIPISINAFVDMLDNSDKINDFSKSFDEYLNFLINSDHQMYTDRVNSIKVKDELI